MPIEVKIFNQDKLFTDGYEIKVTVYKPDLEIAKEYSHILKNNETEYRFDDFETDGEYKDKCFLICADCNRDGVNISRSVYFFKCTSILENKEFLKKYRLEPTENIYFNNGPWLKKDIQVAKKAELNGVCVSKCKTENRTYIDVRITNISKVVAYPIILELKKETVCFFASDNFFMLKPNEVKLVRITCNGNLSNEELSVIVKAWNTEKIIVE